MRNNVVEGVCRALEAAGIASLRFNFRGVGASRGEYTGGPGEQEDARAALAFLSSYPGIDAARVGLAGYSFGSRITMEIASQEPGLPAVAFIGPTNNTISDATALAGFSGPKLFISGGRDHVVEQDALARFVHGLPSPKELRVIPDIDHFWVGAETLAGETVAQFFIQALGVGPPAPPAS